MKLVIINLPLLYLLLFQLQNGSQMEMLPGELKAEPDFVELYYPQKQYVQLSGVCKSVLRISLPAVFSSRLNFTTLSSMKAHFRGLYLASQGSSKMFVDKLMSSFSDENNGGPSVDSVMTFDRKKEKFVCTQPLIGQCRVVSAKPYNETVESDSDWYGTTEFSARFAIGSSDASIFMCNAVNGPRLRLSLFVNTLPTLNELVASIDETTKDVTVRCSGVMSSVFSSVYLWELLIVSPAGNSHRLHEWSNVVYANDKPEPGLMSATLTAVLPTSRIPVAAVTFHCQIVDILGRKFTQRLLPFVLESLMQLPSNIQVGMEKLSPIELLGALPIPPPPMMPLSTIYKLRCSFDSVAPQLVRIVWESYFFNPLTASYVGKRHGLDHQFILLNESLYNNGHHLCRVWLKDHDPSSSLCSEPNPPPRRPVPLCKNISHDTNVSSLLTDLVAFVPLGESANSAPSRDLVVQSMTTALIVLSCVSGIFFLCLIMMIGRFHCRLRPLVRGDAKRGSGKANVPLIAPENNGGQNGHQTTRQPSLSRRNSFPRDARSIELTDGVPNAPEQQTGSIPMPDPNGGADYRLFAPPRPAKLFNQLPPPPGSSTPWSTSSNGPRAAMSSVACEADLDKPDDDWDVSMNISQAPLLSSSLRNETVNVGDSVVVTAIRVSRGEDPNLDSPAVPPEFGAVAETPAPVSEQKQSIAGRSSSPLVKHNGEDHAQQSETIAV